MKRISLLVVLLCSLLPMQSYAALETLGKIKRLYVNNINQVVFKLDSEVPAGCLDNNWPFGFALSETAAEAWLSLMLSSDAQGKEIRIGYTLPASGEERCSIVYIYFVR